MGDRDRLHDGQAQAAAAAQSFGRAGWASVVGVVRGSGAGPVGAAVEPVEGPGGIFFGHARAGVRDLEHRAAAHRGQPDRDWGARRGVLAGVAQQVGQHLPDPHLVHYSDQPVRCLRLDRAAWLDCRGVRGRVPDQPSQVCFGQIQ